MSRRSKSKVEGALQEGCSDLVVRAAKKRSPTGSRVASFSVLLKLVGEKFGNEVEERFFFEENPTNPTKNDKLRGSPVNLATAIAHDSVRRSIRGVSALGCVCVCV